MGDSAMDIISWQCHITWKPVWSLYRSAGIHYGDHIGSGFGGKDWFDPRKRGTPTGEARPRLPFMRG